MWKSFKKEEHKNIVLNPSRWEEIQWIENDSQDIIFICHILDKSYVNYNWVLAEASRLLKQNWEILIVEDRDKEIIWILKKLWLKREEKWSKVVCNIKRY